MENRTLQYTNDFLDELKSLNGNASDYRLAKILEVKAATISNYRHGKSFFDDAVCERVADLLGIQPEYVLACIHAERAKSPSLRTAWTHIAAAFGTAATFVFAIAPHLQSVQF